MVPGEVGEVSCEMEVEGDEELEVGDQVFDGGGLSK